MTILSSFLFVSFFLPTIAKKAGKFSLPLTKREAIPKTIPVLSERDESDQKPLYSSFKTSDHSSHPKELFQSGVNPIDGSNYPLYTYVTNLSVGTPPQPFHALIDLDWADLILPSSTCISVTPNFCHPSNATYNASASSTYRDNGTLTVLGYGPFSAKARLSVDILTITDGVRVPKQTFHEVTHYTNWWNPLDIPFPDGVLGLAIGKEFQPGSLGSPNILTSAFRNMVDQKVLDKNMFSLVVPTEKRKQGRLTFGGYDEDLLDGELVSHPIYPKNMTKWQIGIESVSMNGSYNCGPKKLLVHKKIPNGKGYVMSTRPMIGFSRDVLIPLLRYINPLYDWCNRVPRVPCDEVASLPEITIGLKGQNITLRGQDYVREIVVPDNQPGCPKEDGFQCYVMIEEVNWPGLVSLGMPFLEKVMGVWDWDNKTVSFGKLKEL